MSRIGSIGSNSSMNMQGMHGKKWNEHAGRTEERGGEKEAA